MASATIQQLLQPPNASKSEERALELLNSRFPSLSALEHADTLQRTVEDLRRKTNELRAEFRKSQITIDKRIKDSLAATRNNLTTAQELSLTRHALSDELTILASELVSSTNRDEKSKPTLLEELESLHRNLKELESVRDYVSVVDRATQLSEAAITQAEGAFSLTEAQTFSPSSLTQYHLLHLFVSSVSSHCSAVEIPSQSQPFTPVSIDETQPLRVVAFLIKVRDRAWNDIKKILSSKLLVTAEKMGWPQPIQYASVAPHDRTLFESEFLDLLKLQDAGEEVHASDPHWKCDAIYPIQALATPIALRFKFHFESKRDTNRLDKPEWYFTHILDVIHVQRTFLETTIQALLSKTKHRHINAFREFILHLLPLLTRKLRHTISQLLHHPSLLAHIIYQTLAFDASLREQGFSLQGTSAAKGLPLSEDLDRKAETWEGLSEQIIGRKEWFEAWLEGERKFAEDQYNDIISSPDAWQIADELNDIEPSRTDQDLRPTISARRVKALVEQITDRYQPLPRFTCRTRFLIAIQIPILESYHSRISSSLDAFETLSSSFVRAVPGALAGQVGHGSDTRRLTSGVEGAGRLVKAGLSAHYMAVEMERWGEDLFFLELWAEINARAALRARTKTHPLLPTPSEDVVSTTPQDVEAAIKGTIFQELVTQYRNLGERAEDMIVRHVCSEVESASKTYLSSPLNDAENALPDEKDVSIPTTLVAPLSLLSSHLAFLARSLPSSFATALYRRIASSLAAIILQRRVLQRSVGRLSLPEAKQIMEECLLWVQACQMSIGSLVRRVDVPWARLLDAMKLLTFEQDRFRATVDRIFDTDADRVEQLCEELGVTGLDLGDLIDVVRLRNDCWR